MPVRNMCLRPFKLPSLQFTLDRPQETHMWERFADCIDEIRAGGKPDSSWPEQSALCNKLCIAVERSAQNKCQPIDVTDY